MTAGTTLADVSTERIVDWLYDLRTPVVAVYAIRHATGFILVDTGVVGYEHAYLRALAEVDDVPRRTCGSRTSF